MRATVGLLLAVAALSAAPAASGTRAASAAPSSPSLLTLHRYSHALIQLERGTLATAGAQEVSRALRVWRLPTRSAVRVLPTLLEAGVVRAVSPDRPLRFFAVQADPLSGSEWWRAQVGADRATPPGPGKPLTIIDSGLDVAHPEFAGRPNTVPLNGQRFDDSGGEFHGTAVSSLAAAPENGVGIVGVYPQAVLRMWDAGPPTTSRVIAGLEAATAAGRGVANLSLGFSERETLLEDAVLRAFKRGVVVVASAGNEGEIGSPASFPANYAHVLTVAATDETGTPTGFSNRSLGIDLAAPGENIIAAVGGDRPRGWEPVSGTSFSSPIVAAATAWVWTARPSLEQTQVFDLMRYAARDIFQQGFDAQTGFGMLDIPNALTRPAPAVDPQEPNEDIRLVRARGLFLQPNAPLTTPRRGRASLRARLDATEDPEDVYRVWVPAGRLVRATVATAADVDLDVWSASTPSVLVEGAARRRYLLGSSTRRGPVTERVTVRNRGRRGFYAYVDVYLRRDGPLDASYRLTLSTARR